MTSPTNNINNKENKKVISISYSWDSNEHKNWVQNLANKLIRKGFEVRLDQIDVTIGNHINNYMERLITDADHVLIIMTPNYKYKADQLIGGTGYEYSMITNLLKENITNENKKFLPILRLGNGEKSIPKFLKAYIYLDMTANRDYENKFTELVNAITGKSNIEKPIVPQDKRKSPNHLFIILTISIVIGIMIAILIITKNDEYSSKNNNINKISNDTNKIIPPEDKQEKNQSKKRQIGDEEIITPNGLVGYYPFNGNKNDESSYEKNNFVIGTELTTDRFEYIDKALLFNNPDRSFNKSNTNLMNCGHGKSLIMGNVMSISLWFNSSTGNVSGSYLLNKADTYEYSIGFEYDCGLFAIIGGGTSTDKVITNFWPQANMWYHIAVTYQYPGKIKMYINDILNNSVTTTHSMVPTNEDLVLGCRGPSGQPSIRYFDGKLDDVRIYNSVLNPSEIDKLYHERK